MIEDIEHWKAITNLKKQGYLSEEGEPLRCTKCESENLKERVTDRIDYLVVEKDSICGDCGELLGCWAYGFWEEM